MFGRFSAGRRSGEVAIPGLVVAVVTGTSISLSKPKVTLFTPEFFM
ncbi:16S rRNA processing protein RimM [Corynebacterium tuscaniense]|uniref:16S rRNA processing protein RimM n=1 Tax=Corynebacterium tuscaniense TaxID=302449 RepID=A0A2N6T5D1_9CORY|nr:16S rRNA processing protein RimM [Corynebacterium tuscaniense]PMC64512.1 16S rRNA processing protein RimM [Corynebacterium tuscaniense]